MFHHRKNGSTSTNFHLINSRGDVLVKQNGESTSKIVEFTKQNDVCLKNTVSKPWNSDTTNHWFVASGCFLAFHIRTSLGSWSQLTFMSASRVENRACSCVIFWKCTYNVDGGVLGGFGGGWNGMEWGNNVQVTFRTHLMQRWNHLMSMCFGVWVGWRGAIRFKLPCTRTRCYAGAIKTGCNFA